VSPVFLSIRATRRRNGLPPCLLSQFQLSHRPLCCHLPGCTFRFLMRPISARQRGLLKVQCALAFAANESVFACACGHPQRCPRLRANCAWYIRVFLGCVTIIFCICIWRAGQSFALLVFPQDEIANVLQQPYIPGLYCPQDRAGTDVQTHRNATKAPLTVPSRPSLRRF
jgi:hypothetical protein